MQICGKTVRGRHSRARTLYHFADPVIDCCVNAICLKHDDVKSASRSIHWSSALRVQAHPRPDPDPAADSLRGVPVAQFRPSAVRRYPRRQHVLRFGEIARLRTSIASRAFPRSRFRPSIRRCTPCCFPSPGAWTRTFRRICPSPRGSPGSALPLLLALLMVLYPRMGIDGWRKWLLLPRWR